MEVTVSVNLLEWKLAQYRLMFERAGGEITLEDLVNLVARRHKKEAIIARARENNENITLVLNGKIARPTAVVKGGDHVDIFAPVFGG